MVSKRRHGTFTRPTSSAVDNMIEASLQRELGAPTTWRSYHGDMPIDVLTRADDSLLVKFPLSYRVMLHGRPITTLAATALLNESVRNSKGGRKSADLNRKQPKVGRKYLL